MLVNLDIEQIIHIQTALEISVPPEKSNIILNAGNYYESRLSDVQLKVFIVDPRLFFCLRDVFSLVAIAMLQTMSCAKPVIITLNRGFGIGSLCEMELTVFLETRSKKDGKMR